MPAFNIGAVGKRSCRGLFDVAQAWDAQATSVEAAPEWAVERIGNRALNGLQPPKHASGRGVERSKAWE